ncbi:MAG: RNA-binding S4 domain-containing protein [Lachnospiraceae bacterium]|nr:RNA-binding S4 domain-containing protein [Lachnospiraceae bacterium]
MGSLHLREGDDFIRLGQALKKAGIAESGAEATQMIQEGSVRVNGETEVRRGRKLYPEDTFSVNGEKITIHR